MFNVILIDDEPWALIGLQRIFPWESCGFCIAGAYTDPKEALAAILSQTPAIDAVFSDIRMPDISGIELIKKARDGGSDALFIFISGHADFQYAREAIRFGAHDYLLKPVEEETTLSYLKNLSDYLYSYRLQKNNELCQRIQNGGLPFSGLFQTCRLTPLYPYYQALDFFCPGPALRPSFPEQSVVLDLELGLNRTLYLVNTDKDLFPHLSSQPLFHTATAGISSAAQDGASFRLPSEAHSACRQTFFSGISTGIYQYRPTGSKLLRDTLTELTRCLDGGLLPQLRECLEKLQKIPLNIEDAVFLWNRLKLYHPAFLPDESTYTYTGVSELIQDFKDFSSLCDTVYEIGRNLLCETGPDLSATAGETAFRKLKHYIDSHFMEELYLKDLADQFYLNITYACELFKKLTGTTFAKYIFDLRTTKAASLLSTTEMAVEEICYCCGYHDYSYFIKVFKKKFGLTPFQYRKEITRQKQEPH